MKSNRLSIQPEELELAFLATHIHPDKIQLALNAGVDEFSFQVADHARAWEYVTQRLGAGHLPSLDDVATVIGIEVPRGVIDAETYLNEVMARTIHRKALYALQETIPKLEGDPVSAIQEMVGSLSALHHPASAKTGFFDGEARQRLELLREMIAKREMGETIGIPTGLPIFDDSGDTFKRGDLIAVLGRYNVGKSWMLIKFAIEAWWSGHKVLFLSPESKIFDIEARLDPFISRKLGIVLSNSAIRNATIDMDIYEHYIGLLEERGRRDFVIRDSGDAGIFTLPDIVALTREHRPDVLIVDGFHLIHNGGGKDTWERMVDAAQTIKGLGQSMDMLSIAGSQVTRDAVRANDDTPELGQSAYGLALEETANRVITLAARRNNPLQRIFKVPKHRDGQVINQRQYLHFDVDSGDVRQEQVNINRETGDIDFEDDDPVF